jgi:hypothetical protein
LSLHRDGGLRAHESAVAATVTFLTGAKGDDIIPFEIQFLGRENAVLRTELNTKGAPFAAFLVYLDMTLQ